MKILLCLIALALNLNAHVIGEIFEDTVYGKEADGVKIVGGRSKQAPERRVFRLHFHAIAEAAQTMFLSREKPDESPQSLPPLKASKKACSKRHTSVRGKCSCRPKPFGHEG
jgi:hypothetical protein